MKTPLLTACFSLLFPVLVHAQQVPQGGYWNLETDLNTRSYTIVRFYNDEHQLLREERLDNLCLDLSSGTPLCRRTARLLNNSLQLVLREPQRTDQLTTQLAQTLGQHRRIQRVYAVR
ncbi:hypothetical protein LJ737_16950 [Hymenobacter sp. 15J16-1T3B]|uniref:hypothetical protein n=1 Tax=Hymenobacter sp. 15J16-1T3B TaxID=2886941 RepID=UPI001D0F972E|nr:hypothetical protein [Hymenobacter sp. 15J16-1T3B]MCC3158934.1 hypothetical protein [Hymenobacter sp. 15J16-1T3B]